MKGHRTRATQRGLAAAKAEHQKPPRQPSKLQPGQLRAPSPIERQLFRIAVIVHDLCEHEGKFERCDDLQCSETREILGIKNFLHRFDEPPPVTDETDA